MKVKRMGVCVVLIVSALLGTAGRHRLVSRVWCEGSSLHAARHGLRSTAGGG
ncbi:MAG: hypothetical protein AB1700_12950 [Bacillota bacterium]